MAVVKHTEFNKHIDNEFVITIKKSKTLVPIVIHQNDTFEAIVIRLQDNSKIATFTLDENNASGYIKVTDSNNGQITIIVKKEFIDTLESKRGSGSDNYYSVPTYKLLISGNTLDNGKVLARIDNIKVV